MGGFIAPSTTIGGTVLAPGIPLLGAPLTGWYELPGLNGAGFAINALNYYTLSALGFTYGNKPATAFLPTQITGSPYATGAGPFSVSLSPDGVNVYVANLTAGSISGYSRNPATGALTVLAGSPYALGAVNPYSIVVSPSGTFVLVADNAGNAVSVLARNVINGVLTPVAGSPFATGMVGGTPQGVAVSPNGLFALVTNATVGGGLAVLSINQTTGALTPVAGSPFAAGSFTKTVTASPNGKFVFATNNGGASVSAWTQNIVTGALTPVAGSPFATPANPGGLIVTPDNAQLIVCSQTANNLTVFNIDQVSGVLTAAVGSPFAGVTQPTNITVTSTNDYVFVASATGGFATYTRNTTTGALTIVAGSPFAAGTSDFGIALSPDNAHVIIADYTGAALYVYRMGATSTYNLINALFDPLGGLAGSFAVNGSLNVQSLSVAGAPVNIPPIATADYGKFLRTNNTGGTVWDGVNTYIPVAMVANAGAFSVDDTAEYIIEVTGALTGNGALTATFTTPADPLKVVFDNLTTGGFPLILNATYTIPPGRSYWYWNGATLEQITPGIYNTPSITPLPAPGAVVSTPHLAGSTPRRAEVTIKCLTAEFGYSIGDTVSNLYASNLPITSWFNSTNVGFTFPAANSFAFNRKDTGAAANPTAVNWSYSFIIEL